MHLISSKCSFECIQNTLKMQRDPITQAAVKTLKQVFQSFRAQIHSRKIMLQGLSSQSGCMLKSKCLCLSCSLGIRDKKDCEQNSKRLLESFRDTRWCQTWTISWLCWLEMQPGCTVWGHETLVLNHRHTVCSYSACTVSSTQTKLPVTPSSPPIKLYNLCPVPQFSSPLETKALTYLGCIMQQRKGDRAARPKKHSRLSISWKKRVGGFEELLFCCVPWITGHWCLFSSTAQPTHSHN